MPILKQIQTIRLERVPKKKGLIMSSLSSFGHNLLGLVEDLFYSFVTFFENIFGLGQTIPL
ncbi:hypothetical protein CIP107534_02024 [Corynebacterium diphtheriae]|nr:hypothetical protein CIP107533_02000 [Corynebacterium diphtheriae]CAB0576044.1 hypothetical protein CIP107534_02024 [Corynebacterium diphtheriae]CAB0664346.1 hypothetical protein CIP107580_01977 [Corynebacterium diphtheriae]